MRYILFGYTQGERTSMKRIRFLLLFTVGFCFTTTSIFSMKTDEKRESGDKKAPAPKYGFDDFFSDNYIVTEPWLKQILDRGDDRAQRDADGNTYFDKAILRFSDSIIETFLTYNCTDHSFVNNRNKTGNTPLHRVLERIVASHPVSGWFDPSTPRRYENERAMVLLLLMHGADPNQADNNGETPTHYLLRGFATYSFYQNIDYAGILELFIVYGANLTIEDERERRPNDYIVIPEKQPMSASQFGRWTDSHEMYSTKKMRRSVHRGWLKKYIFDVHNPANKLDCTKTLAVFDSLNSGLPDVKPEPEPEVEPAIQEVSGGLKCLIL